MGVFLLVLSPTAHLQPSAGPGPFGSLSLEALPAETVLQGDAGNRCPVINQPGLTVPAQVLVLCHLFSQWYRDITVLNSAARDSNPRRTYGARKPLPSQSADPSRQVARSVRDSHFSGIPDFHALADDEWGRQDSNLLCNRHPWGKVQTPQMPLRFPHAAPPKPRKQSGAARPALAKERPGLFLCLPSLPRLPP